MASENGGNDDNGDDAGYSPPSLVIPSPSAAAAVVEAAGSALEMETTTTITTMSNNAEAEPTAASAAEVPEAESNANEPTPISVDVPEAEAEADDNAPMTESVTAEVREESAVEESNANEEATAAASAPNTNTSTTPTATSAPGGGDLFAGLTLSPSAASTSTTTAEEGTTTKTQAAAPPSSTPMTDILLGISSSSSASAPPAPKPNEANKGGAAKGSGGGEESRASTPVHSNTSPPPTPSGTTTTPKPLDSPLVVRPSPRTPGQTSVVPPPLPPFSATTTSATTTDTTNTTNNNINRDVLGTILGITNSNSSNTKLHLTPTPPHHRIPNPDTCLRLLRKFYTKTSPSIPTAAGGTMPSSWFGWVFGSAAETAGNTDGNLEGYREFTLMLEVDQNQEDNNGNETTGGGGGGAEDNDVIVESILGHTGDSPSRARNALSSFITLLVTWCRSSAEAMAILQEMEQEGNGNADASKGASSVMGEVTDELIALAIDTASGLVAHGCLDDLYLTLGSTSTTATADNGEDNDEEDEDGGGAEEEAVGEPSLVKKAVNLLVESICIADLSSECTELSALKFLLTTGCRMAAVSPTAATTKGGGGASSPPPPSATTAPLMEPMLRGTHLLQSIRVCSQIYLHTELESNRTTAKAALQQLVVSVFVRLERSLEQEKLAAAVGSASSSSSAVDNITESGELASPVKKPLERKRSKSDGSVAGATGSGGGATFPTQDHRDAYLVLRSLCKLSMQSSHKAVTPAPVLMAASGGGGNGDSGGGAGGTTAPTEAPPAPTPVSPEEGAYDPALESRILALQLLLHILRHSSAPSILNAGPQFHYAVRQYLCTSLLKNTTSLDTTMVELSLRLFVPLIRNFRTLLKTEIEAFVTNVFFVILDSKNSTVQHKLLVVTLFEEICSDATTLAEIFLNYDCDLSAVDLFSRIVNALAKVARVGLGDATGSSSGGNAASSSLQFVAGAGAMRAEITRQDHRELRLAAMKAMRQVLASLHSSIVTPVSNGGNLGDISVDEVSQQLKSLSMNGHSGEHMKRVDSEVSAVLEASEEGEVAASADGTAKKTLVEMYDSKKKRREEEVQAALKFNQKPAKGLQFAAEHGHLDVEDPVDVARYLLQNKDIFDKTQIGEYLGREKEWKDGFALKVLRAYGEALDFRGMNFDESIRYYLSGFRLPGEAQKIDRIMEVFAARYTEQNASVFPTADAAFILAFSIIMLNTDLHNPSIKEDRKMTIPSFIRMNSGVCDGGDFPDEMLAEIFHRIQSNPISLKEDDDARESAGISKGGAAPSALSTAGLSELFFGNHYVDQDKTRESNYQKEGDQIVRDTESMLRRRRKATKHGASSASNKKNLRDSMKKHASVKFVGTADSGLRDEYVTPMFDVAWGPALAVFSTAIESANGTDGILASIATDEEMDHAVDNAALAIEVSLNGFQLAICIAGLCGNNTARDAFVRALYHFTLLGSTHLLADRHVQCVQLLIRLGRDDGELLGVTWEHIFRALTEIYRLHQVWEGMARSERKEVKARERAARRAEKEAAQSSDDSNAEMDDESDASSEFSDWNDVHLEEEMDKRMIDEANAMFIHDTIPLDHVDSIFQRSTILSRRSLKDFVYQLCRVSRMEISGYGGHVGSDANDIDLTNDHYMKHHNLVLNSTHGTSAGVSSSQPAIYSLEKLVEVTHFNMESRPRLIFADIWGTISMHLTSTALHEEAAVAMYAVDSLRQLSLQFLNREELGVFEFQRQFLKSLETIMSRSTHVSVKELLLSSVEQLITIFGFGDGSRTNSHQGTLRSGWRSVLVVLGTAGLDKNDSIALQGFKLLSAQMNQCMSVCKEGGGDGKQPGSLLSEHFVDLVNTLLLYVSGPSHNLSAKSIDYLIQLSDVLAEGKVPLSSTRRKAPALPSSAIEAPVDGHELELWWPMLLGLSQTMGDRRPEVRTKGLGTLLNIINKHFFPTSEGKDTATGDSGDDSSPQHGDLQTLQLIFRGILVPSLEFEEMDGNSTSGFAPELLSTKFVHFITEPPAPDAQISGGGHSEWINSTFEHLMDGCISICLRSLEAFNSDSLVEEVLAMLNSCLLSDSGHLAVKGLRRLEQFVSKDLDLNDITDDTWATVSHMLFRVLSIRGLPPASVPEIEGATDEQKEQLRQDHAETMNEFIREQSFFSNRRYIGCNAAMVIGSLLTNEKIVESMGVHWYIFLTSGLGKGIKDWERAAAIMDSSKAAKKESGPSPPHYLENVLYARRWMTKFLLSLLTQRDVATLETAPCQHVLKEETESLLRSFLAKESNETCSAIEMKNMSKMVSDILECFNTLGDDKITVMKWLSPVLSACIQTNNATVRASVQILLTRLLNEAKQASNGESREEASKQ